MSLFHLSCHSAHISVRAVSLVPKHARSVVPAIPSPLKPSLVSPSKRKKCLLAPNKRQVYPCVPRRNARFAPLAAANSPVYSATFLPNSTRVSRSPSWCLMRKSRQPPRLQPLTAAASGRPSRQPTPRRQPRSALQPLIMIRCALRGSKPSLGQATSPRGPSPRAPPTIPRPSLFSL